MKRDIPHTVDEICTLAKACGFFVPTSALRKGAKVISLDESGTVLRFFAPEVQIRPWGDVISGLIGLALSSGSGPVEYDVAVFHNVMNIASIRDADRSLDDPLSTQRFLGLIRSELAQLPSTPAGIIEWCENDDGWLAKQVSWGWPGPIRLLNLATELAQKPDQV